MYLNFSINCTPDATIRLLMDANTNDYITLNGNGVIRATYYDKGAFNMYGTYTVDHGTYGITIQNILKKNLTFNQGSTLVFGGNPFDAQLNLQAVHTVNGVSLADLNVGNSFSNNTIRVNCLMNIGGIARAPQVNFDIRYLLTPNGNIALKVYNQTNDRYFTKSSLNTQGVGLIMKKDFTNLRDLFGKKRKKKGSRKEE